MRPRVVIFDVDGTLIDTLPALHAALNAVLAGAGIAAVDDEMVRRHVSVGMDGLLAAALDRSPGPPPATALRRAFGAAYAERVAATVRPFAGVDGLLAALRTRGYRLALCSNGAGDALRMLLRATGWQHMFEAVVDADSARALKPSAEPVRQVLESLAVPPVAAWLVGDSEYDALSASAAGCGFAWAAWGYGEPTAAMAMHGLATPQALLDLLP